MTQFNDTVIREDCRTVEVGAGLTWADVYKYLVPKGLDAVDYEQGILGTYTCELMYLLTIVMTNRRRPSMRLVLETFAPSVFLTHYLGPVHSRQQTQFGVA
jgi:hypothetical protein